ncbi:flagellar hook-length control protein FliK [Hydrogenophaga sp.]|uniref:flagellar hook-length control protein FliK n=1 Tax=Hydrogenophaga sp. TaxID=1904254 RepID=UPI00272587B2|nr:flagellar hook-length control protein FliK [Hydrogenophaga sp.]MDO8905522.1 flagellar hook-length control protein FliK [Hydrogenophaga sp.]
MSSTAASASQSGPSSTSQTVQANRPGQPGARRANESGADSSLFANLLSLLADTHEQPLPDLGAEVDVGTGEDEVMLASEDVPEDNPLAALAGWPGSPVPVEPTNTATAGAGAGAGAKADAAVDQAALATDTAAESDPVLQVTDEPAPEIDMAAQRAAHESPQGAAATAQRPQAALKGLTATAQAQAQPLKSGAASPSATAVQQLDGNNRVWRRTGGGAAESASQSGAAQLAGVRSTVTLNDRFGHLAGPSLNPVVSRDAMASGLATVQTLGGANSTTGTGATAGSVAGSATALAAGSASGADAGGGDHADDAPNAEQDGQGAEAFDGSSETEGQQISHWGTQNLRHASLRVGQGGQDAIDIQLSVKGQEVQVDFRTDNADARASLRNSADESLAEMLQRSGIQLAGVSVGAQGQGSDRNASSGETTAQRAGRAAPRAAGTPLAPEAPRMVPLRADGSRPLDLFV